MKSNKLKTLGICIATFVFVLMAVASSSTEDGYFSKSNDSNVTTTTAATTKKVESVSYSTNDKEAAKAGNKGIYAYENEGGMCYIIDFNGGYVYDFTKLDSTADRVKIVSGNLNDVLIITYHDVDGSSWSYGLHFKWKRQPDHLIVQDKNGTESDFIYTNLKDALSNLYKKTVTDYSEGSPIVVDINDLPTMQSGIDPNTLISGNAESTSKFDGEWTTYLYGEVPVEEYAKQNGLKLSECVGNIVISGAEIVNQSSTSIGKDTITTIDETGFITSDGMEYKYDAENDTIKLVLNYPDIDFYLELVYKRGHFEF